MLEDNLSRPQDERKLVYFIWTASRVEQFPVCFPSLLVDLSKDVHAKSGRWSSGIDALKRWLHLKVFISNFEVGELLSFHPGFTSW